jgi:N-acetylglucosaminyl-diphospho-decaprenol L-rhamnosyltransferase
MSDLPTPARSSPQDRPEISALLVNYNTAQLLEPSIGALRAAMPAPQLQIIVIDNASRDDSVRVLQESFADCTLIANPTNVGFGRANNQALPLAQGRYVLLVNTDAFVGPETLSKTLAYMDAHPRCGVLGVKLLGRDGELQPSCRYFPTPWNVFLQRTGFGRYFPGVRMIDDMNWDHASPRDCDWVPGCYYLVRREVIDQVGLFDPRYFLYYEEVDHCRAVKAAGWSVVCYAATTVVHLGGESAKSDAELTSAGRQISQLQVESELLYFRKHHGLAGVWLSVALMALADTVLALKWLLRRRPWRGAQVYWVDFASRWSLLRRTAWATRPTR